VNSFTFGDQAFLASSKKATTPASFAGLAGWWKADSYSEADNTVVGLVASPWVNIGGGGNASSATSVCKFRTNIIGTMPVVRFDGATLGRPLAFTEVSFAGDYTAVFVCSVPTHFDTLLMQGSTGHQFRRDVVANPPSNTGRNTSAVYDGGAASPPLEWWGGNVSGGFPLVAVDTGGTEWAIASSTFQVNVFRRTGQAIDYRQNKTTIAGSGNSGLRTMKVGTIGNLLGTGGGAGDVDMGEIFMYSSYLTDTQLDLIYDKYLKPRWTTLP
jgi:hypothetical protein